MTVLSGGSTNPPVVVPLTGSVNPVQMTYHTLNSMIYILMMPANYDSSKRYPLVMFYHQDDAGKWAYANGLAGDLVGPQIAPWFNNRSFLTNFPCFMVAPLLDQRPQTFDGQINFGGYGNSLDGHNTSILIAQSIVNQFPIDTQRIYSTGNSMGGTATYVNMLLNSALNGTQATRVFAAGLTLSGVDYEAGGASPAASVINQVRAGIPIAALHGSGDTEQPSTRFSLPLYQALGGVGGNAGGMPWSRAASTNFWLQIDSNLGHDTWDTYYVWPKSQFYFNWLFQWTAAGSIITPPVSPPPTPPGPGPAAMVTNIVSSTTGTSATLTWLDPNSTTDTYNVGFKKTTDTTFVVQSGITVKTYTITGLIVDTVYDYEISVSTAGATSPNATGQFTTQSTAGPPGPPTPAPPPVTPPGPPSTNAPPGISYTVGIKKSTDSTFTTVATNWLNQSFQLTGLQANTVYVAEVAASNSVGMGPFSFVSFQTLPAGSVPPTPPPGPPGPPDSPIISISLSNLVYQANAPAGTIIGNLTDDYNGPYVTMYLISGTNALSINSLNQLVAATQLTAASYTFTITASANPP